MRLIRGTSSNILRYIKEHLIIDESLGDREQFVGNLEYLLLNEKENTFILAAFETEGLLEPELLGFLIAYAPPDKEHVFLSQAWESQAGHLKKISDACFLRLINWMRMLNRSRIFIETKRDESALARRWNFTVWSQTLTMVLDDNFEAGLAQRLSASEKSDNGQQQTADNEQLELGTEADRSAGGTVSEWEDRPVSDTIRREADGGLDPGTVESEVVARQLQPKQIPEAAAVSPVISS